MRRSALVILTLLCLPPAHGHRTPECFSVVTVLDSGIEVVHRLHAHDATAFLDQSGHPSDLASIESRARIAHHVSQAFGLSRSAAGESPLALTTLGAELDGDFLYVYQETGKPEPEPVYVLNRVFMSAFANAVNVSQLRHQNATVQVQTTQSDRWQGFF